MKIIHTADTHFGVENYGKINPENGLHSRLIDFCSSFNTIIDYAIDNAVDCFVFAGDAYKTSHPTPTHQKLFINSLLRLVHAKIPLVIVIGNHDYPGNIFKAHALDICYSLDNSLCYIIDAPSSICIFTKSGPLNIVGIPWPTKTIIKNTLDSSNTNYAPLIAHATKNFIYTAAQKLNPIIPALLVGHLTVATGQLSGSERAAIICKDPVFSAQDLAIEPFDYVALGHLHKHQNCNKDKYPAVVYSGSPDYIDFGEIHDAKGFCCIDIPKKGKAVYTFIPLKVRPFYHILCQINTYTDIDVIFTEHQIKNMIVKVTCTYNGNLDIGIITKKIHYCLQSAFYVADIQFHATNTKDQDAHKRNIPLIQNKSVYETVDLYCQHNKEYQKNRLEYLEIITKYS